MATFIRTTAELEAIASYRPFAETELKAEGHSLYIGFMAEPPGDEAKQKLRALTTEVDDFHLNGRELYWLCRSKISDSVVSPAALSKALAAPMTLRNSTTVRKLAAKYRPQPVRR